MSKANYNTAMKRLLDSGKICAYPSYESVIGYIGEMPEATEFYSYQLSHNKVFGGFLKVTDFYWNRTLRPSLIDDVFSRYQHITSRQQVKKALQKLSYNELSDVISGEMILKFKTPYNQAEDLYLSNVGKVIGSYRIIEMIYKDMQATGKSRTEYNYVVQCEKCKRMKVVRCYRIANNHCKWCPFCASVKLRRYKNSTMHRDGKYVYSFDFDYLREISMSEYSRFFSYDPETFYAMHLDSKSSEFTDIFGDYVFEPKTAK